MQFTFLGTSSGVPCKNRNVTGLALQSEGAKRWYMVDCGEATQHQLLNTRYSVNSLKAIFITHVHGDHCYGLPGMLASASMLSRTEPLTIVGPAAVKEFIDAVIKTTQLWLDYQLIFIAVEEQQQNLYFDDVEVEILPLSHRVACWGYNFIESRIARNLDKDKLLNHGVQAGPAWGQLQRGQDVTQDDGSTLLANDYLLPPRAPRVVMVAGDNDNPALLDNLVAKPDVVVHESTYTEAIAIKVGPSAQHSYAKQVAQYAQQAQIKNLVLTHFSPRYIDSDNAPQNIGMVEAEAKAHYQGRLFLARDFAHYVVDKQGLLQID
jgi:ribonuclease Z